MVLILTLLFSFFQSPGGIQNPTQWSHRIEKVNDTQYKLIFELKVDKGWGTYSQYQTEVDGPVKPIEFVFEDSTNIRFIGKNEESGHIKKLYDKFFDANVVKIIDEATFTQIIEVTDVNKPINGYLDGIVCDDEKCTPFDHEFSFTIPGISVPVNTGDEKAPSDRVLIDQSVSSLQSSYSNVKSTCTVEEKKIDVSLLLTFVFGFLGGLLALLTPCVFPLIPLTVSFFTKSSRDRATGIRNGVLYGLSIIVIYVGIGLLITSLFGETALNDLSTNWLANLLFFIIFVLFAFSFFGFYEITLPSSWSTKTDQLGRNGNLIGIFFMAFTLAIVSFSCTGPIIGTALVQSATSKIGPAVVMFGFALALALPFGLFAAFPAWLQSLPKSGSWMNSVKVVLGFLELALAFKFLSVSDMTSHWGFLRYELFMGIWILLFAGLAAYLFGWYKFPHDSPLKKRSVGRMAFASLVAIFTLYLCSGFMINQKTGTYHSLSLLSGLAPPAYYNFFKPLPEPDAGLNARFKSFSKCANNLDCFKDYTEGVAYAKEVNKPILLDFTGYGCVNCRKTEEHIWVNDEIWKRLAGDFVLVSLYCDDETPLDQMIYSKTRNKKIRNIGNKWEDFQIVNFQQNSQPLYVPIDPNDQQILIPARGYHSSIKGYQQFLDCAHQVFKTKQVGLLGAH
ncbi:MAG: cytochrome c biogenesis protein CcdA [Saprospiraceae bacterium]|nr:cytochrome c biogenesis protein CcdA [Saprospiraceae bacterium]